MPEHQINKLQEKIKDGTFEARSSEDLKEFNGKKKLQGDDSKNIEDIDELEGGSDEIDSESESKKKITLKERIDKRLRKNYEKAKMSIASDKVDRLFSNQYAGDKEKLALIAMTYDLLSAPDKRMKKQFEELGKDTEIPDNIKQELAGLLDTPIDDKAKSEEEMKEIAKRIKVIQANSKGISKDAAKKIKAFTTAYQTLQETDIDRTKHFMNDYMKRNPRIFGKAMDPDENGNIVVNPNRLRGSMHYIKNFEEQNSENLRKLEVLGVNQYSVLGVFSNVSMHKRTPGYILRGSFEAIKDGTDYLKTRVLASKPGRIAFGNWKTRALMEGSVPQVKLEKNYNKENIRRLEMEYMSNRSASAAKAGKQDIVVDIPDKGKDTFDDRYVVGDGALKPMKSPSQQGLGDLEEKIDESLVSAGFQEDSLKGMSVEAKLKSLQQACKGEVVQQIADKYKEIRNSTVQMNAKAVKVPVQNGEDYGSPGEEGMEI